jgi:hypothetical protein
MRLAWQGMAVAAGVIAVMAGLTGVAAAGTGSVTIRSAMLGPAAPAVVLVNQPVRSICSGHKFRVGVWFQQYSGGSRAYRIAVSGPKHRRFFYRHGSAPESGWRFWHVLAGRAGRYVTTYWGHRPGSAKWTAYRAITRAKRC